MNEQRVFPGFAELRDPEDWVASSGAPLEGDEPVVLLRVSGEPGKDLKVGPFEEWMVGWLRTHMMWKTPQHITGPREADEAAVAALEAVLKGARP
jgi:hypothetical protein